VGRYIKRSQAKSIDAHNLWKSCGRPTVGDIYNVKRCAKAKCKSALRQKDFNEMEDEMEDDLHDVLLNKEQSPFWKTLAC